MNTSTSAEISRLRRAAADGDPDAVEALRRHAARSGPVAEAVYADTVRGAAGEEIRRRTGAGAVRRLPCEDHATAQAVAALLTARKIEATVAPGSSVVQIAGGDLFALSAAGLMAPVAPDGSELVGRIDKGPWTATTDEEGRRRSSWAEPVWAVLRPSLGNILTAETAARLEDTKTCPHCSRAEGLGYRRFLFILRRPSGEWVALGSTCAADLLGVSAEALFPNAEIQRGTGRLLREFLSQAQDEVRRGRELAELLEGQARLSVALRARDATRYGDEGYHLVLAALEAHLATANVEGGEILNTMNSLLRAPASYCWTPGRLSSRGRKLADWYEAGASRDTLDAAPVVPVLPPSAPGRGDRGVWSGTVQGVRRFNDRKNRYQRPYQGVTLRLADGRRVWFPAKAGRDVRDGDRLTVYARVSSSKVGIVFLGHVARVDGLRPDLAGERAVG